jgi:phytoene dehydrogenase-like protein
MVRSYRDAKIAVRRPRRRLRHGLLHPDLRGPNRPGPKGFRDLPIGIDGLYLGGAGCHGGPGTTFIRGYNAAYQVLEDHG